MCAKERDENPNILIVEDDDISRLLLGRILKGGEYIFKEASSAAEARKLLEERQFELILSDIGLPGESGLDFIRFALSRYPHTAAIMVTGQSDLKTAKESIDIGAYDYIIKPFEPNRVLFSVVNALKRREIDQHKHTKEELIESELKYRLFINNIPGFVYKGYKDWSVDFTDNKVGELTGYDKEEFDARRLKWSDLMLKEDIETSKKCILQSLDTDGAYIREYRIKTKTGKIIWTQDRGQIVRSENGEIDYFSGVFFDITKQKQAEENLQQNERYYRSILKHMHESIVVIDKDYQITDVNNTFLTNVGCSREKVIGHRCHEISHGYNEPCHLHGEDCKLMEVFETGEPRQCLHEHLGVNGASLWVDISLSPLRDDQNKVMHVIESARDVTRQKQAEEALLLSEEKHRLLVANASDAIVILQDESIKFANPKAEEISGYSAEELTQISLVNLIHPEDRDMVLDRYQRKSKEEKLTDTYTFRIQNKTGQEVWVQLKTTFIPWEGKPAALTFLRDISEIKQVEEREKQIKSQLLQSEKMASIGQLAAGVAHEINNPTGFVSSNLRTLADYIKDISGLSKEYRKLLAELKQNSAPDGDLPDVSEQVKRITDLEEEVDIDFLLNDISELIEESRGGTERIKKIVQDLKDFAHPGEDKPKFADINKNLDSTVNVVWNEIKYKAEVTKDYGDLPAIQCYPQLLNQVFVNILVNAAQSIKERGKIGIKTRADNGYVEIKISDTGSGIPKENLAKIFDPFFTTKEVGKGTGLGMNVAYNIIKKHNGLIDVESEVGKGTTFTIKIPVQ